MKERQKAPRQSADEEKQGKLSHKSQWDKQKLRPSISN